MKSVLVPVILVSAASLLCGCKGAADEAEPTPTATVDVQPAAQHPIEEALIAYGTVEFVPAHTRSLSVQVESQVAERFVLPGTAVKQGQPLMRLIPSATSRLDVDKAARDASVAAADAQRVERLHAQGLATDSDLRTAKAAEQTALQLRDSLIARIGTGGKVAGEINAYSFGNRHRPTRIFQFHSYAYTQLSHEKSFEKSLAVTARSPLDRYVAPICMLCQ